MTNRTVCVIQQVAPETPGAIASALKAAGWRLHWVRPFRGEPIPRRLGRHAGLVVMGGPMGVYDTDRYPFLRSELRLIEDALAHERPVLGVCLGSQLLATALGAPVFRGPRAEIGWHEVYLTRAAGEDPLWQSLPAQFTAFHWHGDAFDLPRGARLLAWSRLTDCQAFRYDAHAYGLLFHLEVNPAMVRRMARHFRDELLATGQSVADVLDPAEEHLETLAPIGRAVFQRWAGLLSPPSKPSSSRSPTA